VAVAAGLLAAVTENTKTCYFYSPPPVAVESPLFSYVQ